MMKFNLPIQGQKIANMSHQDGNYTPKIAVNCNHINQDFWIILDNKMRNIPT